MSFNKQRRDGSNLSSMATRLSVVGLVSALLVGCQSAQPQQPVSLADFDYRQKHPIILTEASENFDIPLGGNTRNINRQLSSTIMAFGQQAKAEGNGYVEVLVPSGSANEAAAKAVTPQIRSALKMGGVEPSRIVTRAYPVDDSYASAPIRLSFARTKAVVPHKCGEWPENLVGDMENTTPDNFGCSYQANLAAMIDNPADLVQPRAETPVDVQQRRDMFGKYRTGQQTPSQYKEGVGAQVSESL
ncbi:CpaD family pilus assembly protein [Pseudovibrio exalbescens]|uniref:CpaD family pilus assembly protein n=1 Tax=Pseudovibrio exalbescens TaxID=197461 RepID=UPI002366DE2A|nr:CpaD family pilus assembly protein [Pseudovibrio exalbescens]MDD7910090.1 CpaD family pilus assembly protein [Pseudovibrio exalbescens]